MRWTIHGATPPKIGDQRTIQRLLWFPEPLSIQGEPVFVLQIRWLEWATIVQEYTEECDYEGQRYTRWRDRRWAKEADLTTRAGVTK
jgi:hypothetical protein